MCFYNWVLAFVNQDEMLFGSVSRTLVPSTITTAYWAGLHGAHSVKSISKSGYQFSLFYRKEKVGRKGKG